jgi:hypothetical protein
MAAGMKTLPLSKAAQAAFSVPDGGLSESSDNDALRTLTDRSYAIVRMRRPDGREYRLRVPAEHLDRLIALASEEFGGIETDA